MPKKRSASAAQIQLVYDGPEVKDGTIGVEDMVDALIGFGRAYAKAAGVRNIDEHHNLRVSGIKRNSADIIINVLSAPAAADVLVPVAKLSGSVAAIIASIVTVIKVTRHLKGAKKPAKVHLTNHGTIQIFNTNNVQMEIPKKEYELYESGILRQDLHHLTRPLNDGHVDSVEMRDAKGERFEGSQITAAEREFFRSDAQATTTTRDDVWIDGYMKSLNKDTNSGSFYLESGDRIRYKLAGKNPEQLWRGFVEKGPVRVLCRATFDESLRPIQLEIFQIQSRQKNLFGKR